MSDIDPDRLLDEPSYFVEHYLDEDPFEYQRQFMDHPSTRKAFVSGRRVGKSRTASWLALWYAVTHSNVDILITAKAQRQASELFNQVKSEIRTSDKIDEDTIGIGRNTRTEINFSNGSRIKCLPVGRDGSNIRGFGAQCLIVDEAAFIDNEIFKEVLSPMLAVGGGTFILLSTPFGKKGFLYERWNEATQDDMKSNDPDTDWYPMQVPTSANPLIDDDFIDEQRDSLTDTQFKQEILGEFVESADSFFTRDELMNCAYKPPAGDESSLWSLDRSDNSPAYLGVDLAGSGDDESVFTSIDADGNVYDIEGKNISLSESMKRVEELDMSNDYTKILVDATGLGEGPVEQLRQRVGRKVEGFKFTNAKKQSLYNTLKNKLQQGELQYAFVPGEDEPENKFVNQALELEYSYTSTDKMKISHPSGGHDDYTDSLCLAVWAMSQKNMARGDKGSMKPFSLGSLKDT